MVTLCEVIIIGGGLAGAEAAWQVAKQGVRVILCEMRPKRLTPAHQTGWLAELVCSNSLKSAALDNAAGLLKEEMRRLDSLIIRCADSCRIPAGQALAVDRELFAQAVTSELERHPLVTIIRKEVTAIPAAGVVIVASGPLTSTGLSDAIARLTGAEHLYFYDAVAPLVLRDTIDFNFAFYGSRYSQTDKDYINCPLTAEEYEAFYQALVQAEVHPLKEFEGEIYFEGCLPIEVLAKRGRETLRFGPMKPVGLVDPRTGQQPYAVVQLRQDNQQGTLYNLVGFQTNLKWGEQDRVFRLIPALRQASFERYGVMHRNTFIASPAVLAPTLQMRAEPRILFAGQITGVEGYVESAASGLVAGLNAGRIVRGRLPLVFPPETVIGALCHHITNANLSTFQPINATFGVLPPLPQRTRSKRERHRLLAERSLMVLRNLVILE